eukprot:2426376-Prymnesium_polylepis.1
MGTQSREPDLPPGAIRDRRSPIALNGQRTPDRRSLIALNGRIISNHSCDWEFLCLHIAYAHAVVRIVSQCCGFVFVALALAPHVACRLRWFHSGDWANTTCILD